MNDKDFYRLRHMFEEMTDIESFIAEGVKDKKTLKAIIRSIEVVGEAARHISSQFKDAYPHIPWKRIIAMRNFISHEYFRVDEAIIWQFAQEEIPELANNVEKILKEVGS